MLEAKSNSRPLTLDTLRWSYDVTPYDSDAFHTAGLRVHV